MACYRDFSDTYIPNGYYALNISNTNLLMVNGK